VVGGDPRSDSTYRTQSTPKVKYGTVALDPLTGNIYMFVQAGAIIPINSAVTLNGALNQAIATSAAQQLVVGVADTAFASGDSGWIMTDGVVVALVNAAVVAGNLLVSYATAGSLQLAAATDFVSRGAMALTAASGGLATIYLA
jgi:hypothetical protein